LFSNGLDLNKVESLNNNLDLTQELRRLPGVQIVGEGEAAAFQIRGVNSFTANTSPLFVVDGQTFEDYATVYRLVAPANFRSARVLKSSSDLSMYGVRGSNGVIVIKTK